MAFDWISDNTDVDFYKVRAPQAPRGETNRLRATVLRFRDDGPRLRIAVYDANRQPVAAEVVTSEGGVLTVQTGPVVANANYYVVVSPCHSEDITSRLNYSLTVAFDTHATPLETFVSGTLGAAGRQDSRLLRSGPVIAATEADLVPVAFSGVERNAELELISAAQPSENLDSLDAPPSDHNTVAAKLPFLVTVLMLGQLPMLMGGGLSPFGMRPSLKKCASERTADAV